MIELIPSLGDLIRYQPDDLDAEQQVAIVTAVASQTEPGDSGRVTSLVAFSTTETHFRHNVPFSTAPTPGSWHWPARA